MGSSGVSLRIKSTGEGKYQGKPAGCAPPSFDWELPLHQPYGGDGALVLCAALQDVSHLDRPGLVFGIGMAVASGKEDCPTCLPILQEALNDQDPAVRQMATNVFQEIIPMTRTNVAEQIPAAAN